MAATTRRRILTHFTTMGWVAFVQTRIEHFDPPDLWKYAWETEAYAQEKDAIRRAKIWVKENLAGSVE